MNILANQKSEPIAVLLVDDEDPFRETLAKRLAKRRLAVDQAAGGDAGLAILARKSVDVVVLDVKMPGVSGIDVLHQVKAAYPQIEVILLTGHASTADGVEGIKAGAFDYLTKPIELDHLINKITQAYEKIQRLKIQQAEAQYREKMAQQMIVTERLASLGTMAAGVAHEINNPLAIIHESAGWMSQLLTRDELKDIPFKKDFENALHKVEKSVDRARRITQQLLGFVQKSDPVITEINLAEIMEEVLQPLVKRAETGAIQIVRQLSAESIWTDSGQIRQVFHNLLSNAIYAVRNGGTITIAIEAAGDQVVITFRDTGEGIARENLDKIFEPFFTTKPTGAGTGLGLFVSRGIVEKLGGTITVKSRSGQGTEFRVILPKYAQKTKETTAL